MYADTNLTSQAEVLRDGQSKLLQNSNINIKQLEGQSENMKTPTVEHGSVAEASRPPETKPEVLQTKISQPIGEAELLSKLEQEHRLVRRAGNAWVPLETRAPRGSSKPSKFDGLYPYT